MTFALNLAGRSALVTGGTQGVGQAVVIRLTDAGVGVLTTARSVPSNVPNGVIF